MNPLPPPTSPLAAHPDSSSLPLENGRFLQVLAELWQSFEKLADVKPAVTIFGSARLAQTHPICCLTESVAQRLSAAGFTIITGGGPGVMEAANRGAKQGGGRSIGLNIQLPHEEKPNPYLDIALKFHHFFIRKDTLIRYADAYIIMPGGFGTLDEMTEVLTLLQNAKIRRAPLILVGKTFWAGLLTWFEQALLTGEMIHPNDLALITVLDEEVETIVTAVLQAYSPENCV